MLRLEPIDEQYQYLKRIIDIAVKMSDEEEWIEFKHNNQNPELIGQYISALGNMATLLDKEKGYIIWGISDNTHEYVGTNFDPSATKKGGEPLESYISHMLSDNGSFQFYQLVVEGKTIVVATIDKANHHPLSFSGTEYIRVGANLKKLKDFPEIERKLWLALSVFSFELDDAMRNVSYEQINQYLDLSTFYLLLKKPFPSQSEDIIEDLKNEHVISIQDDGRFSITNCGALALGRKLSTFPSVATKTIRVILHNGEYLTSFAGEKEFDKGYATCFDEIIDYILDRSGREESFERPIREMMEKYPMQAIREMLGNTIIHQDLTERGSSILVHLYSDRLVMTNPGKLLCDAKRTIDTLPKVRNEILASLLRKMRLVEEQGSGFDRIEEQCAIMQMPSVEIWSDQNQTTVTLYQRYGYSQFSFDDLIRTCYNFICLRYFNHMDTSNQILRKRLGVEDRNAAIVSRLLKECLEYNLIKKAPSAIDSRAVNYVPFYA